MIDDGIVGIALVGGVVAVLFYVWLMLESLGPGN
jgi:hypothetical protein